MFLYTLFNGHNFLAMFLLIVQWAYLTCIFFLGYVSTHCSMGIFNMRKFFLAMFLHIVQWAYLTCIVQWPYLTSNFFLAMFLHMVQWPYLTCIFLLASTHGSMAIFNMHFFWGYVSTHCSMAIFNGHIFVSLCFYTLFNVHI